MNSADSHWRDARRRALREGAPRRPPREDRRREALELLRHGPIVVWPHKHFNAASKVALRDLVKQGLATVAEEERLDLAAYQRGEYTLRLCKVYRLKPTPDVDGE